MTFERSGQRQDQQDLDRAMGASDSGEAPTALPSPQALRYDFTKCDECGAELAPNDRLWGLCPECA